MEKYAMVTFADGDVRVYENYPKFKADVKDIFDTGFAVSCIFSDDKDALLDFAKLIRDPKFSDRQHFIPKNLYDRQPTSTTTTTT